MIMEVSKILEKSGYQSFDFLGSGPSGSRSGEKYKLSKIGDMQLEGTDILDVGCNAGYFLYRILLEKKPNSLLGIDLGDVWIDIANLLNEHHFKSDKVKFICGDFFTQTFDKKFDLILCISTFHYMVNQQQELIDKCHSLLNEGGILLLEVEEYTKNDVPEVNHDPRPYDPAKLKLDYPNNLKVKEYIAGKFDILERYASVVQGGSVYARYFYRLLRN